MGTKGGFGPGLDPFGFLSSLEWICRGAREVRRDNRQAIEYSVDPVPVWGGRVCGAERPQERFLLIERHRMQVAILGDGVLRRIVDRGHEPLRPIKEPFLNRGVSLVIGEEFFASQHTDAHAGKGLSLRNSASQEPGCDRRQIASHVHDSIPFDSFSIVSAARWSDFLFRFA